MTTPAPKDVRLANLDRVVQDTLASALTRRATRCYVFDGVC